MRLKERVDKVIDLSIRGFDPQSHESYVRWDSELEQIENLLRKLGTGADPTLLSRIAAERIRLASETEDFDTVLVKTATFLREFPAWNPGFPLVVATRVATLHATGAHDREIEEVLATAKVPEVQGREFVSLLSELIRRHPGCIPDDESLRFKLSESLAALRDQGFDMPSPISDKPINTEELICRAADELYRANLKRGLELLS